MCYSFKTLRYFFHNITQAIALFNYLFLALKVDKKWSKIQLIKIIIKTETFFNKIQIKHLKFIRFDLFFLIQQQTYNYFWLKNVF